MMDDLISRQVIKQQMIKYGFTAPDMTVTEFVDDCLPSEQQRILFLYPEDYTELKRELLRMAGYIDVILKCSDAQKETLMGFISRLAEFMPWTERN